VPQPGDYAPWLLVCTLLFLLRVLGQVVVVLYEPRWLPPMKEWYSGLLPYRYLLPSQILILALQAAICRDFFRGEGFSVTPRPHLGRVLVALSFVYWGGMALRFLLRRRPLIPILLHCVLAAFLYLFGRFHAGSAS
jgi:hypothetical protein